MAELDLDAIEARAKAATPGVWRPFSTGVAGGDHWYIVSDSEALAWGITSNDGANEEQRRPDAEFIANARADVPALVAEVRRLHAAMDAALALTDPDFNPIPEQETRGRAGWKFAMEHVHAALAAATPNPTEESK